MKKQKDKPVSLRIKTFRIILTGALLLILLISFGGLGMHAYSELTNYHDESRHLMDYAMSLLDMDYLEKIFAETEDIYFALPEEIRSQPFSDEFAEHFYPLVDDEFYAARDILVKCREKTENRNMFLMFEDREHDAIVYVVDGDDIGWAYLPGQWLTSELDKIDQIDHSKWRLNLTHTKEYGWIGTDYHQIAASDGSPLGYIVMDVDMNDFFRRIIRLLYILIPAAIVVILLMAVLASQLLNRHILKYLIQLASAAKEYTARDKIAQIDSTTSYFDALGIRTQDELQDLWQSMTDMEADVNETMHRLKIVTAEQEHMEAELSIATQIQVGTLPHTFPAFPDRKEFDIYAAMVPAREVGGDFYDFFLVDDDHLAMVIADVSGKGISAALFMVNAKALIQNQTKTSGENVAEVLATVNNRLMEQNEANLFVTVWLGILTISTGHVVYSNAGHEYPAIRRNGGLFTVEKDIHCAPLAAMEDLPYRAGAFDLQPGDTLFTYTDGVTEANDSKENLFGMERMLDALNQEPDADPKTLDKNLRSAIGAFAGDAPQFDDTTTLCLKYFGPLG